MFMNANILWTFSMIVKKDSPQFPAAYIINEFCFSSDRRDQRI